MGDEASLYGYRRRPNFEIQARCCESIGDVLCRKGIQRRKHHRQRGDESQRVEIVVPAPFHSPRHYYAVISRATRSRCQVASPNVTSQALARLK